MQQIAQVYKMKKKVHGNNGKKLSKEHRLKISEGGKGRIPWNKGKNHSEETKRKISINNKGKNTWSKGKKLSKEHILKLKEARKNIIYPKNDTSIEIKIQKFLTLLHIEYFTHKYISEINNSYQCDILIPVQNGIYQKTIIECDGCYWHCCKMCKPKEYNWTKERRERDKLRTKELQEKGYKVIRLWEHEIRIIKLNDFKKKYSLGGIAISCND